MSDNSRLTTVTEACKELRLGRTKVYQLISSGWLRTVKIGSGRRVIRDSIDELIDRLAEDE